METNILLIEPDKITASVIASALKQANVNLTVTVNVANAMHMLREHLYNFDLIIADPFTVSIIDVELIYGLKADARSAEIPVLVSTGAEWQAIARALTAGASDYICKPFRSEELKLRALTLAGRHRLARTAAQVQAQENLQPAA